MPLPDPLSPVRSPSCRPLRLVAVLCVLAAALLPVRVTHAEDTDRLVVLEPSASAGFTRGDLKYLSDQIRKGALQATRGSSWEVMARENMETFARANDIDLQACQDGSLCEVDVGRAMQAQAVVAFDATQFGTKLTVTIKLFDTVTGKLLEQTDAKDLRAAKKDDLAVEVAPVAEHLIRDGLKLEPAPRSRRGRRSRPKKERDIGGGSSQYRFDGADEVLVTFTSTPAGAVVLVDGDLLCASTPCTKPLTPGPYDVSIVAEQYEPVSIALDVTEEVTIHRELLAKFGLLTIETVPSGLPISIDGKAVGRAPLRDLKKDPGQYDIVHTDPCYQEKGKEGLEIKKGESRTYVLETSKRMGGLKLAALKEDGNHLKAKVLIDGVAVGWTPYNGKQVSTCAKRLRVEHQGAVAELTLNIEEGQPTLLEATFPQWGPGRIVEAAGQRLVRGVEKIKRLLSLSDCGLAEKQARSLRVDHPKELQPQRLLGQALACKGSWQLALKAYDDYVAAGGSEADVRGDRAKARSNLARLSLRVSTARGLATPDWSAVSVFLDSSSLVLSGGKVVADLLLPQKYILRVSAGDGYLPIEQQVELTAGQTESVSLVLKEDCDYSRAQAESFALRAKDDPAPQLALGRAYECSSDWPKAWQAYEKFLVLGGNKKQGKRAKATVGAHLASVTVMVASSDPAFPVPTEQLEVHLSMAGTRVPMSPFSKSGLGKIAEGLTPGSAKLRVSAGPEFEEAELTAALHAGKRTHQPVTLRHYDKAFLSVGTLWHQYDSDVLALEMVDASGESVRLLPNTHVDVAPGRATLEASVSQKMPWCEEKQTFDLDLRHGKNTMALPWAYMVTADDGSGKRKRLECGKILGPGVASADVRLRLGLKHGDMPPVKLATTLAASPGRVQHLVLDPSLHPLIASFDAREAAIKKRRQLAIGSISSAGAGVAGIVMGIVGFALAADASSAASRTADPAEFDVLTSQIDRHSTAGALGVIIGGAFSGFGLTLELRHGLKASKALRARRAEHDKLLKQKTWPVEDLVISRFGDMK
jgi:hypothetical protein